MCSRIRVEGSAWVLFALLVLLLPLNWVLAAAAAGAFHELCHLLMLRWMGVPVYQFRIGIRGAVLETASMTARQELWGALAGPAGSFLLIIGIHTLPRVALCGAVQGIYNLLPMLPMDGGRCVNSVLRLLFEKTRADSVMKGIERITKLSLLIFFFLVGWLLRLWIFAGIGLILTLRLMFPGKSPCKPGKVGVQ